MSLSSVEIVVGAANPSFVEVSVSGSNPSIIELQPTGSPAVVQLNIGPAGTTGAGVAAGGSANDILKKTSSTDYETEWETPTSGATSETIVRRDATGGAFFGGDVGAPKYRGNFYQAESATDGASLRNSAGTAYLTWGATAGNISITVDLTSTGNFYSAPITATAGHFVTKNGTAPTIVAGRSAWFSNATGDPQFRNGTGSAVTLIYNGGALGTPSSGTLTSCTGLPVSTGISGLGTNVAAFLATPTSANLRSALTDETGSGAAVFATSPTISTPKIVQIKNTAGTTSLNTDTATLFDLGFSASIDFENRWLYGLDATYIILDWLNGQLNDSSGNISVDWFQRYLSDNNGVTVFDYTGNRSASTPLSFDGSGNVCLTKRIAYYNNFATAGNGQPAIRAVNGSTLNAAAKTATTLYAVPAANGGTYRVSFVAKVTRAATTSSVLGGTGAFQAIYTDADDSVVVTTGTITNVSGATLTGNTTQIVYSGTVTVNAKASTNIQFTFGYTSVGATTMQYNLHVRCEQI